MNEAMLIQRDVEDAKHFLRQKNVPSKALFSQLFFSRNVLRSHYGTKCEYEGPSSASVTNKMFLIIRDAEEIE